MRFVPAFLAVWAFAGALVGAETRTVPEELAQALNAARQAGDVATALKSLEGYRGPAHPLLSLALGHAYARSDRQEDAEKSYRQALALDPLLHEAGLGLAGLAARREDWSAARQLLAAHCDANADDRALLLYAQAAWRTGDARLATVLTQQGLVRFPDQPGFRRLDLALLIQARRWAEAAAAARSALAIAPRQAELWRQLAYCEQEAGHPETAVAALEAAWLVDQDPTTRRRLAEAQLALGQATAALPHFRALVGEPARPESLADAGLMAVSARAAADGGEPALARAWLAAVPPPQRDRGMCLLTARLALQAGDAQAAEVALEPLLGQGEADPAVLRWAGNLAEKRGDAARAEALYRQAAGCDGAQARLATLNLAHLLHRDGRSEEALKLLAIHLDRHPDDAQARALWEVLRNRKRN
jgi:tetratricopeptide (TPR) repeat protein